MTTTSPGETQIQGIDGVLSQADSGSLRVHEVNKDLGSAWGRRHPGAREAGRRTRHQDFQGGSCLGCHLRAVCRGQCAPV